MEKLLLLCVITTEVLVRQEIIQTDYKYQQTSQKNYEWKVINLTDPDHECRSSNLFGLL